MYKVCRGAPLPRSVGGFVKTTLVGILVFSLNWTAVAGAQSVEGPASGQPANVETAATQAVVGDPSAAVSSGRDADMGASTVGPQTSGLRGQLGIAGFRPAGRQTRALVLAARARNQAGMSPRKKAIITAVAAIGVILLVAHFHANDCKVCIP